MGERQTEDLEVPCSIHGVRTIFFEFFFASGGGDGWVDTKLTWFE